MYALGFVGLPVCGRNTDISKQSEITEKKALRI